MACAPTAKFETLSEAVLTPLVVLSEPWPMLVAPSKKVTMPVGMPQLLLIVAVSVTAWLYVDGLAEEPAVAVVVAPTLTFRAPAQEYCETWAQVEGKKLPG